MIIKYLFQIYSFVFIFFAFDAQAQSNDITIASGNTAIKTIVQAAKSWETRNSINNPEMRDFYLSLDFNSNLSEAQKLDLSIEMIQILSKHNSLLDIETSFLYRGYEGKYAVVISVPREQSNILLANIASELQTNLNLKVSYREPRILRTAVGIRMTAESSDATRPSATCLTLFNH